MVHVGLSNFRDFHMAAQATKGDLLTTVKKIGCQDYRVTSTSGWAACDGIYYVASTILNCAA
jgi:hypothetical protein